MLGVFVVLLILLSWREASVAAIGMPVTMLAAVGVAMVPLRVIGGIDGKFIRVIPVTAIVCLCPSFGLAFLGALPLSRYVLGRATRREPTRMDRLTDVLVNRLYSGLIARPVRSKRSAVLVVMAAGALFVLSVGLAAVSPAELYRFMESANLSWPTSFGSRSSF